MPRFSSFVDVVGGKRDTEAKELQAELKEKISQRLCGDRATQVEVDFPSLANKEYILLSVSDSHFFYTNRYGISEAFSRHCL